MKSKIILLFILSLFMASCSSDDAKSEQFRFLEFEKDVILPSANSHDITFLAMNFDAKLSNWNFKLTDDQGNDVPTQISKVEDTRMSYPTGMLQRISFSAAPKTEGVYTLVITNKTTGQLYTDHFLVKSKTFNEMVYPYTEDYTIISSYGNGESKPTQDYIYFQNIKNTINSTLITTGISGIRLEDATTFAAYNITYSVNSAQKIEFTIPQGIPQGKYFISVRYNNLTEAYFEKDIVVQAEKWPVLNSINKNTFKPGEIMTLKGLNFRYKVNSSLLPNGMLFEYEAHSAIMVDNGFGMGEIALSNYDQDPSFKFMNKEGTEIHFPIPKNTGPNDFFYVSDSEGTYFDGTIAVRSGAYISEPVHVRIEFK